MTHAPACDIPECGDRRCIDCTERMTCHGPEPRACGDICVDCPCDCQTCAHVRADLRAELMAQIARESR